MSVIFFIIFLCPLFTRIDSTSGNSWERHHYISKRDAIISSPVKGDYDEIVNKDPNNPKIRDSLYDHIYFSSYDGGRVYTNQDDMGGTVARSPHTEERNMLNQVQEKAVTYLAKKNPSKYTKEKCSSIRYRTIPKIGIEADVTCNDSDTKAVDRLSVMVPLNPPKITYHHSIDPTTTINIIMPLKGMMDKLEVFMVNMIQILQESPFSLSLTVVYFEDSNVKNITKILQETESKVSKHLKTQLIVLESDSTFSRTRAIQVGVEKTSLKGDILFFCDADVIFKKGFLTRCMLTPIQGSQIFVPLPFSLYKEHFVFYGRSHTIFDQLHARDRNGLWKFWGHELACVYKSDVEKIGRFVEKPPIFGGEDTAFVEEAIRKDFKIIRQLDPELFHLYEKKECGGDIIIDGCLKVNAMSLAPKLQLGAWLFNQKPVNSFNDAIVAENHRTTSKEVQNTPMENLAAMPNAEKNTSQDGCASNLSMDLGILAVVLFSMFSLKYYRKSYENLFKIVLVNLIIILFFMNLCL